jgi:NADPH2:quinone reductase
MKAIQIFESGGPDVLKYVDLPDPVAGLGQAVVRIEYAGVNYGDTALRRGTYPGGGGEGVTPGIEAIGRVTAVGEGVTEVRAGDEVAIAGDLGCYAEYNAVSADRLIPLPPGINHRDAAAALQQGRTAHYLAHDAYPIQPGDRVLVHAGAGGVGMLLVQMAKNRGAYVFTTVSSDEKAAFAREIGADEVIVYTRERADEVIQRSTGGEGVQAAYDHVGKDTFEQSLNSLARKGHLVMYGVTSGPPPPVDFAAMRNRGSFYVSTHSGADYRRTREELIARAHDVFRWLNEGALQVRVHAEYSLADAWQAHRDIESRATIGKLLLRP